MRGDWKSYVAWAAGILLILVAISTISRGRKL